jgi:hypothetical protein
MVLTGVSALKGAIKNIQLQACKYCIARPSGTWLFSQAVR